MKKPFAEVDENTINFESKPYIVNPIKSIYSFLIPYKIIKIKGWTKETKFKITIEEIK